ncbi:uncharacterized protein LOC141622013 [Silene latifolia]|uniref:uncharacterized protein LOC141622013 n=1 Tax=Silene latifolia TaxID=37657 RepID=UPI003D7723AC
MVLISVYVSIGEVMGDKMECEMGQMNFFGLYTNIKNNMEGNAPCLILPNNTNNYPNFLSTGYLEDALLDISLRFNDHLPEYPHFTDDLGYWNKWLTNYNMNLDEEVRSHASVLVDHDMPNSSSETIIEKSSRKDMCEEPSYYAPKLKELSSNSKPNSFETNSTHSSWLSGNMETKSKRLNRKRSIPTKMVYPFGIVKPGGKEGDITLKDINRTILMPPTRPLKHPVGDYASRSVLSMNGPGLSGKAIVGLTRIHTRGRGTITIIRTKG